MPRPTPAMKKRHLRLLTDLSNHIDPSIDEMEYKQFQNLLRDLLTPLERKKANDIMDMFRMMEDRGTIGVGNYSEIKNALQDFKKPMIDIIVEAEEDIENLKDKNDNSSTPTNLVSSIVYDRRATETKRKTQTECSVTTTAGKKPRTDLPDNITHKSRYEKTRQQTGYHVIVNFNKGRDDSHFDVVKLREFYEGELKWKVEEKQDLTKSKMEEYLRELQEAFSNKRLADMYHCLCVTLMSHGNEKGIEMDDGSYVPLDDIIKYFKNDRMPAFAGKPKIFFIQACRGKDDQQAIDISDDEPVDMSDYVGKLSVPVDSDVLIAYATTPGYRSYRRAYTYTGSWFLNEVQEVFEKDHETDHVEEMLITVRENLAYNPKYRTQEGRTQMPCCWTTLTKRLYL